MKISDDTKRAGEIMSDAINRASRKAKATLGSGAPVVPSQGGTQASSNTAGGPQATTTGGGGGGNTPPVNGGGGGGGGGTGGTGMSSNGGFDAWFKKLSFPQAVGVCVISFSVVSLTLHSISVWNNERADKSEAALSLNSAQNGLEIARIKEETAALQRKTTKTSTYAANMLRTVEYSTFDCRAGKLEQGFATTQTVVAEKGTQLLVKGGCIKLRFDHEVTALQAENYLISFEVPSNPGAELFGNGKMGRFNSPKEVMDILNANRGKEVYLSMDGHFKARTE